MSVVSPKITKDACLKIGQKAYHTWHHNDEQRDLGMLTNPKGIKRYNNIQYGPDSKCNRLDVYRPTYALGKPLPLIIYMHGGGFIYGYRKTYQFYCMHLARAGFAVVNYDYHLAPKYPFPYAWNDNKAVVQWCADHANQYNFDLSKVFLAGDSAGANFVEQYLTLYSNPKIDAKFHFKRPNLNIIGGVFNSGVYFIDRIPYFVGPVVRLYYTDQAYRKYGDFINMDKYIKAPYPPVLITTASHDDMISQNIRMDQLMDDRKVPHTMKVYGDETYQRDHDFQVNIKDPIAKECYRDEITFFKKLIAMHKKSPHSPHLKIA